MYTCAYMLVYTIISLVTYWVYTHCNLGNLMYTKSKSIEPFKGERLQQGVLRGRPRRWVQGYKKSIFWDAHPWHSRHSRHGWHGRHARHSRHGSVEVGCCHRIGREAFFGPKGKAWKLERDGILWRKTCSNINIFLIVDGRIPAPVEVCSLSNYVRFRNIPGG